MPLNLDGHRPFRGAWVRVFVMMLAGCAGGAAQAQLAQQAVAAVEPGELPRAWLPAGPRCAEVQPWQVHEYNPTFFILRQSGCTDYEKPFVYLIFGKGSALLYDTGSRAGEIVPVVQRSVHAFLERNGLQHMELYVVHSHGHEDHVWGDKDLRSWSDPAIHVTVVPSTVEDSKRFYKMANWPDNVGHVDLGGRVLDAIAIPGHQAAAVALYDRATGVLLTGDNVYPGRLYIEDLGSYTKSNERLIAFTEGKPVSHLLGCHVEQKRTAFEDYPVGTIYQPEEHVLELARGVLFEIREGLQQMHGSPARVYFPDFTLWPSGGASQATADDRRRMRSYEEEQQRNKWDQTKAH